MLNLEEKHEKIFFKTLIKNKVFTLFWGEKWPTTSCSSIGCSVVKSLQNSLARVKSMYIDVAHSSE